MGRCINVFIKSQKPINLDHNYMSRHVGITHLACVPNTSRMCARHNTQTLLYLVLYYSPSLISFNDKALMRAHSSMRCLLLIQSWHTLLSPLCLPHLALLSQAVLQLPPAAAGPRVDHRQGAGECGRLPVMEEVSSCGVQVGCPLFSFFCSACLWSVLCVWNTWHQTPN